MSDSTIDRRRFLLTSSAAAVTLCAGRGLTGCGPATPSGVVDSGLTVAEVAVGTVVAPTNLNLEALVGRDANGLYAYTTVCPHQGGTIPLPNPTTHESTCSLHQSLYTMTGDLAPDNTGPSTQSLNHFAVSLQMVNGVEHIFVDTGTILTNRSTRTPAA